MTNFFKKYQSFLEVLFLIFFLAACTPGASTPALISTDEQDGIIRGQELSTQRNRFNSVVGIRMYSEKSIGVCTGTLIRHDIVLTAAHCVVSPENYIGYRIVFSNSLKDVPEHRYRNVVKALVHKNFKDGLNSNSYDIALLQFAGTLPEGYAPSPLMNSQIALKKDAKISVVGFGVSSIFKETGAGVLRHTEVKVANPSATETEFRINQWIRGVCMGDSGGPAFMNVLGVDYIVGITNKTFAFGPVHCIISSYFVRTDKMMPWIRQGLKLLKAN